MWLKLKYVVTKKKKSARGKVDESLQRWKYGFNFSKSLLYNMCYVCFLAKPHSELMQLTEENSQELVS